MQKTIFDSTSLGLIYTLAALFLCTTLLGFAKLGYDIYIKFVIVRPWALEHVLTFFITLFVLST